MANINWVYRVSVKAIETVHGEKSDTIVSHDVGIYDVQSAPHDLNSAATQSIELAKENKTYSELMAAVENNDDVELVVTGVKLMTKPKEM